MEIARPFLSNRQAIWVCGRPRFLRETLAHVLKEKLGARTVIDVPEQEPPVLTLPEQPGWLIWFLNGNNKISSASAKFAAQPPHLNLLLIQGNGDILIRRADRSETRRADIALQELCDLLNASSAQ
jgi:hypothetical protein